MTDWIGLIFLILLVVGVLFGLRALSKPRTTTSDEFEKKAAEGTTALGAILGGLNDAIDPASARAKITVSELKQGRYQKKKKEGKSGGNESEPPA